MDHSEKPSHAQSLRKSQTTSEGLLWAVLRAKQVSGLKFRRQHRIGRWIADFACLEHQLVIEIDGGYHDQIVEKDLNRQQDIASLGWQIIRFTAEEVELDAEAAALAITRKLGVPFEFRRREGTGSGMKSRKNDRG